MCYFNDLSKQSGIRTRYYFSIEPTNVTQLFLKFCLRKLLICSHPLVLRVKTDVNVCMKNVLLMTYIYMIF